MASNIPAFFRHVTLIHEICLRSAEDFRRIAVRFSAFLEYPFVDSVSVSRTSATLLRKLRGNPTDQAVWSEFVGRYGPKIVGWCRRWNLPEADGEDVTQNVLLLLAQKMSTFDYDPSRSFRGWLKTLTRHAWSDYLEWRQKPGRGSGDNQALASLDTIEARDDLVRRLDDAFDRELFDEATARVRMRVAPHTWDAFRLTAIDGLSGATAAQQLEMQVATVFKAKSKVQKMLQEILKSLDDSNSSE
jgi:RNA polymerase sigma-70 factor (ECF subfamily)